MELRPQVRSQMEFGNEEQERISRKERKGRKDSIPFLRLLRFFAAISLRRQY